MTRKLSQLLAFTLLGLIAQSCCEPRHKDSRPEVQFNTYSDTAIYDQMPNTSPAQRDSGYYPVYSFDIKNAGTEADTFIIVMTKDDIGFRKPIFVMANEIKRFTSPDSLRDTSFYTSQQLYNTFFRRSADSISIQDIEPTIKIIYGEVYEGPEACNTAPSELFVDPRTFERK